MNTLGPTEIEFKYNASEISLKKFMSFCEERKPDSYVQASGFDRFYASKASPDSFCRHREELGRFNQLSFKRKTADKNNYVRTEHNITLDLGVSPKQIEDLCKEFGYTYVNTIYKSCFIYKFSNHIFVYYICYDADLKELGRFLEIEMDEDYPWADRDDAMSNLVKLEVDLKPLGVSPQARIKRSLFEMFANGN